MTHRHFCTYFDHRYFVQGLALYRSLQRVCPEFTLWVLALDGEAERILTRAALTNVQVVPLATLEDFDSELYGCRENRSLVEYYFTCSPCLPWYLLQRNQRIQAITYLDSDLYFFNSPEPIFRQMGGAPVGIVPHRFSPRAARSHGRRGQYNVGWLTFTRSVDGLACLDWWRQRCIEWCYDRLEGDRYADQKYLDQFTVRVPDVHVISHPGANLAPWNVARHSVALNQGKLTVDREPLIFFHFQGLRRVSRRWYDSNLGSYGASLSDVVRENVFVPYLNALDEATRFADSIGAFTPNRASVRRRRSRWGRIRYKLGRTYYSLKAAAMHNLVQS